jgi:hypothetical protein
MMIGINCPRRARSDTKESQYFVDDAPAGKNLPEEVKPLGNNFTVLSFSIDDLSIVISHYLSRCHRDGKWKLVNGK